MGEKYVKVVYLNIVRHQWGNNNWSLKVIIVKIVIYWRLHFFYLSKLIYKLICGHDETIFYHRNVYPIRSVGKTRNHGANKKKILIWHCKWSVGDLLSDPLARSWSSHKPENKRAQRIEVVAQWKGGGS